MSLGPRVNNAILSLVALEHRIDPYFRDAFDAAFQRPLSGFAQRLLRLSHGSHETRLCQEIPIAGEESITAAIIGHMSRFTEREYSGRTAERAGNTKTYGVVRGNFQILSGLPTALRAGIFAQEASFPVWIRFAGPGPGSPPDVRDGGILSIGIKLMGVPGEKLLEDERATQDFLGISSPTFTTPNVVENLKLQRQIYARTPLFYFLKPLDSHLLDLVMQGLYARMNSSPLETRYWSCVPFLYGEGQAMKYAIRPRSATRTRIPWNPPPDWLRQAMGAALNQHDIELDFLVQLQTNPARMPIEDASIEWPEELSPFIPVAHITIPRQTFSSSAQFTFVRQLAFNPWHSIAEHRPLGNQNRARRALYQELSRLRQAMNREPHREPDGSERFD